MRKCVGIALVGMLGLVFLSGCGPAAPAMPEFQNNELAVTSLGGTSWGDPNGQIAINFDENAKVTGFTLPAGTLPPEFASVNVSGQPFQIQIPAESVPPELAGFAGKTYTATMENTKTVVGPDNRVTLEFTALVAEIPTILLQNISFSVDTSVLSTGGQMSLSDLVGTVTANTVAGPFTIFSGGLSESFDVKQLN